MSQLYAQGSQNTGASASASVLPMNIKGLFPLGLTGLGSPSVPGARNTAVTVEVCSTELTS